MLTRLKVNGFKNLVNVDVRFGPFTCIAGANGVGKSNLFDAIRFLSSLANQNLLEAALGVRDDSGRNTDVRSLFYRGGDHHAEQMSFEAEMIVPRTAVDDLGQTATATTTFLRYSLTLGLRKAPAQSNAANPLEILHEELTYIRKKDAPEHLLFEHNAATWRSSIIHGARRGPGFISTTELQERGGQKAIAFHQDGGSSGRAAKHAATHLPRTVLSSATASENPTALCARREVQSWQLLQLEPSALRQPDEFSAPAHLTAHGSHLAATLQRLASRGDPQQVFAQVANRLSALIGELQSIRIERDEKRELLTLMACMADGTEHPARTLSDGTLRFLALATLELDPEAPGVLCLEEPENGIHPDRIAAMLMLLQDIALDPNEPCDETNPLRQIIINTHSPAVVMNVPDDSLLLASNTLQHQKGRMGQGLSFVCLPDTWRAKPPSDCSIVSKGEMLAYLNPVGPFGRPTGISHQGLAVADAPHRKRRVMDHPEFTFMSDLPE